MATSPHTHHPPLLLTLITVLTLITLTHANLCALCQSLRNHVPTDFDSCLLRNLVIKHCDETIDVHLSTLKIVGVKRVIRVNYDDRGNVFWEIGVQVVQDGSPHQHYPPPQSQQQVLPQPQNSTPHHNYIPTPPSSPHSVQLAVIRFTRYPSSLLLVNPCRHVLGTINNSFFVGKRKQFHRVPTNSQRISSLSSGYFVIDDKLCQTQQRNGFSARKRCNPTYQNSTNHPYECCVPQPTSTAPQHALPALAQTPQCPTQNTSTTPDPPQSQEYLRPLTLSIQCICICFTLILSCVIFWIRKSKVIQVSVWPLTESIIFGSTLLYTSVAIRASYRFDMVDHDSDEFWWEKEQQTDQSKYWACVAEPWAREIGFTLVYGGVVLKIYRSLVEFRTRKAHRWVVREKDILRYLGTSVAVVLFYVLAWSLTVEYGGSDGGVVCPAITNWHRVTEIGELVYVAVGLNMAWHLRTSPVSPFLERQMYTAALVLEATASVLLIIVRECKLMFFDRDGDEGIEERVLDNHDNGAFLLLLYFVRCHATTTIILGLVLGPKLYYVYVDTTNRKRAGQLRRGDTLTVTGTSGTGGGGGGGGGGASGTTGGGGGGGGGPPTSASLSNLTTLKIPPHHGIGGVDHHTLIDLDFAEVSLADMDPQDIKMELKRVYTQLELLRNKTMRKDNPHISKRRGGRKPTHRRFSLQKKGSRDKTAAAAAAMRSRMQAQAAERGDENRGYGNNRYSGGSRYQDDIEDSVCSIEGPSTYSEYR